MVLGAPSVCCAGGLRSVPPPPPLAPAHQVQGGGSAAVAQVAPFLPRYLDSFSSDFMLWCEACCLPAFTTRTIVLSFVGAGISCSVTVSVVGGKVPDLLPSQSSPIYPARSGGAQRALGLKLALLPSGKEVAVTCRQRPEQEAGASPPPNSFFWPSQAPHAVAKSKFTDTG